MANTFVKIASVTVGAGGASSIDFTSIPGTYTDLKVVISARGSRSNSGSQTVSVRFNSDSGANYSRRSSTDGGADATAVSSTVFTNAGGPASGASALGVIYVTNITTQEKVGYMLNSYVTTTGAASAPSRNEVAMKWVNIVSQINRVDVIAAANSFATNSEVIVLGHD